MVRRRNKMIKLSNGEEKHLIRDWPNERIENLKKKMN